MRERDLKYNNLKLYLLRNNNNNLKNLIPKLRIASILYRLKSIRHGS